MVKDAANDEAVVFKTLFALCYTVLDTGTPEPELLTILFSQICQVIKLNSVINLNFLLAQSSHKCLYIALMVYIYNMRHSRG